MYPVVGNWSSTLSAVGVPPSPDSAGGQAWGSYIATSSINPANWTRSYARSAYLDPLPPRANLAVLTGNTVTRLIFSGNSAGGGNLTATQVEYASGASAVRKTVNVGKEVILAGGAVGSPQILMLSGVGPQGVLTFAGVNASLVLPGVGHHLQDHLVCHLSVWYCLGEQCTDLIYRIGYWGCLVHFGSHRRIDVQEPIQRNPLDLIPLPVLCQLRHCLRQRLHAPRGGRRRRLPVQHHLLPPNGTFDRACAEHGPNGHRRLRSDL